MGIVSSISITFSEAPTPSQTLAVLHDAGWRFLDDRIQYQHYSDVVGADWQQAEPGDWNTVCLLLDTKSAAGEKIAVLEQWQEENEDVAFTFHSNNEMEVLLTGISHRLCGRFTDFSWYLDRILCPLDKASYTILEVTCNDDNY